MYRSSLAMFCSVPAVLTQLWIISSLMHWNLMSPQYAACACSFTPCTLPLAPQSRPDPSLTRLPGSAGPCQLGQLLSGVDDRILCQDVVELRIVPLREADASDELRSREEVGVLPHPDHELDEVRSEE